MIDIKHLHKNEANDVFVAQILRYSYNTIKTHSLKCSLFFNYCRNSKIKIFPVVPTLFCSFLLDYGRSGKTFGQITSLINSLNFICKLFGSQTVTDSNYVKNTIYFLKKVCVSKIIKREGFSLSMIDKLNEFVSKYGFKTLVAKQTYIMIIVCFYSLMRFDCIRNVKLSCIKFHGKYVEITIPRSKTDQHGKGRKAYIISNGGPFDPYFLLCKYLYEFSPLFGMSDEYLLHVSIRV